MKKKKTIKAWAIMNTENKILHNGEHFWIFKNKGGAEEKWEDNKKIMYKNMGDKIAKIEIKIL